MPDTPVLSELGETAARRLAARTESHAAADDRIRTDGRHLPARWLDRHANALVDLVAITESYFAERLARAVPGSSQPSTWRARSDAWRDKAGVDVAADPRWPALMGFVEARNALQHGLGRLTASQLDPAPRKKGEPRRTQVLRDLDASGLHLNGDRVTVLARDVERCAAVCRHLVLSADAAVAVSCPDSP